jgi:hypothetical protein
MWLSIKRAFDVRFLVFVDDILILGANTQTLEDVYIYLENALANDYSLQLNASKTHSGRFASQTVSFCGYEFAGGYARVTAKKIEAFKQRLTDEHKRSRKKPLKGYIKRMNRKIDGFGNYYKHGDVGKQYEALDIYVRKLVRERMKQETTGFADNAALDRLGLHSLTTIHQKRKSAKQTASKLTPLQRTLPHIQQTQQPRTMGADAVVQLGLLCEQAEKINSKLTQLLALERKQLRAAQELAHLDV